MNQPIRPRRIPKTVTTDAMRTLFTLAGVVNFYVTKVVNFLIDEDILAARKSQTYFNWESVGRLVELREQGAVPRPGDPFPEPFLWSYDIFRQWSCAIARLLAMPARVVPRNSRTYAACLD